MAVARAATVERYGLDRRYGAIRLAAAVLDPFVYAGVVYFIVSTVFGLAGATRFHLILLGFIVFRWTLVSALHARELNFLRRRLNEHTHGGLLFGLVAILAPPTLAFIVSLGLALLASLLAASPERNLDALPALPAVIAVQLAWTALLVLALDALARRGIQIKETAIIGLAALVWIFSPIMYTFADLAIGEGAPFVRLNPAAYIMAAYHNAYWGGRLPTPTTLLGAAALAGLALWVYVRTGVGAPRSSHAEGPAQRGLPHLVVQPPGLPTLRVVAGRSAGDPMPPFERWRGRLPPVTGRGLANLVIAASGHGRIEDVEGRSAIGALFSDEIEIYPEAARDQLSTSLALIRSARPLVLAGTLDEANPGFLASLWPELERRAANGDDVVVIASEPLALPAGAAGTYKTVGPASAEGMLADIARAEPRAVSLRPGN